MRIAKEISDSKIKELIELLKKNLIGYAEVGGGYGYRFYHSVRVMNYCRRLLKSSELKRKGIEIDKEALLVGALFHDIGVIARNKNEVNGIYHKNHEAEGSKIITKLLGNTIGRNSLAKISEIILEHHSENPKHPETLILQDADNLDEFGLLDIWRMASYASFMKKSLNDQIKYWHDCEKGKLGRKISENRFHFKISKKIAERRLSKAAKFMEEIEKESKAEDFYDN